MTDNDHTLHLAELFYNSGEIKSRYARKLSSNGKKWIRHGLWRSYHRNGEVSSEGEYVEGFEQGLWKEYHENGILAAQGQYEKGQEIGQWQYWNEKGEPEG